MPFLGGLGSFLFGRGGRTQQFPRFGGEQQQAISQILQQALSGLRGGEAGPGETGLGEAGLGRFDFGPIEQRARTQFGQQTIPSIAERFTGMGEGGQRSSAFQAALGRAGAGLEESLAGMKSQYGLQQQGLLQNLLGMGLTPQHETAYFPRQPGFLESTTSQALPMLLRMLMGS